MLEQQALQTAGGTTAGCPVLMDLVEVQASMPDPNPNTGPTLLVHSYDTMHPNIVCVFMVIMVVLGFAPMGLVAMIPCIILAIPISWAVVTVITRVMDQIKQANSIHIAIKAYAYASTVNSTFVWHVALPLTPLLTYLAAPGIDMVDTPHLSKLLHHRRAQFVVVASAVQQRANRVGVFNAFTGSTALWMTSHVSSWAPIHSQMFP